jgi:hypothetical protein
MKYSIFDMSWLDTKYGKHKNIIPYNDRLGFNHSNNPYYFNSLITTRKFLRFNIKINNWPALNNVVYKIKSHD